MVTIMPINDVPANPPEPERVSEEHEAEYVRRSHETRDVLKAEENMRREAASRAQRMRQAEIDLRKKGRPHDHYVQAIDKAVEAMRRDAAA